MKRITLLSSLLVLICSGYAAAEGEPLTFQKFIELDVVGDPQISHDGKWVAFVVSDISLEENRGNSDIWVVAAAGGEARRLTTSPAGDSQPRWSPTDNRLAFVSSRSGSSQIYLINPAGGEAEQVSDLKQGIGNLQWAPDGKSFLFSSDVSWPALADEPDPHPTQALVFEELLYRHWDEWRVGKRSHLFHLSLDTGKVRDLTQADHDFPTIALGGYQDVSWSTNGASIAAVVNLTSESAFNTNNDIVLIDHPGLRRENLTSHNVANDNNPIFSPDGRWLAYRAQFKAGFEADRHHLMLRNLANGETRDLTPDWSLSVGEIAWATDSGSIFAVVQERLRNVVYRISIADGSRQLLADEGHYGTLRVSPSGDFLVATRENADRPDEVYRIDLSGGVKQLSRVNDDRLKELEMNPAESFEYVGAMGETVEGMLVKPPRFDPARKYPLVYLIHGGPQGAWTDNFHARWNYQMFAAPGYVVAMVNFHGSTGYGQPFTDSISGHWGDYPYEDVMKGVKHVVDTYPFVDSERMVAAGASYGGYMINWLAGDEHPFRALINHDGVFNMESMYGETEELWFPEWEYRGPLWSNRELYRKWSPHNRAQNFKTPMLVVHGQLDFRVDVSQGFEVFTALRRQGVPARFVYFPDEGHWVLQPRNRKLWWAEVLGWIARYVGS